MVTQVAKSIDDVMTEARAVINDSVLPYRFQPALLLSIFNTAIREIYRYRPDAFIGNFTPGVLSANAMPTYELADFGQAPAVLFPCDDRLFFSPVVFYVAGKAELSDDEF